MDKGKKQLIMILLVLAVMMGTVLFVSQQKKVPKNPADTVGNTAGNLNNGGRFCEDADGTVYFANAYDNYALYSMNSDESDMEKLSNAQVKSLNSAGKYLYYYQTNSADSTPFSFFSTFSGIYRIKKSSRKSVCLSKDTATTLSLCGNTLYYENFGEKGTTLRKIGLEKSASEEVLAYAANPASVHNGVIYFNGTQHDHYLYTLNTASDSVATLWTGNLWNPVASSDGFIYYMDLNTNYNLCRYSLSEEKVTVLSTERVEFFNVYGDYVYFQTNSADAPALKRVRTDGSLEEVVAEGIFEQINITSEYVYFNRFQEPVPVYKTSTTGPVQVSTFDAAFRAAGGQGGSDS